MADQFQIPSLQAYQMAMRQGIAAKSPNALQAMGQIAAYDMSRKAGYKTAEEKEVERASQVVQDAEAESTVTDPLDRQYDVLSRAARRFTEMGMIDYVQKIAPQLTALHREKLENAKLSSEADENVAQREGMELDNAIKSILAPATIAKGQADARAAGIDYRAWYNPNTNTTRPVNEKNPEMSEKAAADGFIPLSTYGIQAAKGEDLSGKTDTQAGAQVVEFETAANAAALAAGHLADLLKLLQTNPSSATLVGQFATFADKMGQNAKAIFRANNVDIDITAEGDTVASQVARSLPRASAQAQGMVVNLIYAQARVNDPGGRLSNQDVQVLAQQFDPTNPQVLADTANRMLHQNARDVRIRARGLAIDPSNPALKNADLAYEDAVKATAPIGVVDPGKLSDEELLRRLNNAQ